MNDLNTSTKTDTLALHTPCSSHPQLELLLDMVTLANLDCDKLSDELEQKENELAQR
jgi:hypothetical protein